MGVVHILIGIGVVHAIRISIIPIYILKNAGSIMRFLCTGDWQLRFQRPRSRIDIDYALAQEKKVEWLLATAVDEGCAYLLQPGDFFDSCHPSFDTMRRYIELFKRYEVKILCVRGQHDLRYQSTNIDNIPLAVLEAAGVVEVASRNGICVRGRDPSAHAPIVIYGCSWGDDVFYVDVDSADDTINVLLIHKMVTADTNLQWPGQTDFVTASSLLEENSYDLVVCGDNHKSLIFKDSSSRYVVNCGSLMRANIDQVDHKPVSYIYESDSRSIVRRRLTNIAPAEAVFAIDYAERELEKKKDLDLFIRSISKSKKVGVDFLKNLYTRLDQMEVPKGVRKIIDDGVKKFGELEGDGW